MSSSPTKELKGNDNLLYKFFIFISSLSVDKFSPKIKYNNIWIKKAGKNPYNPLKNNNLYGLHNLLVISHLSKHTLNDLAI